MRGPDTRYKRETRGLAIHVKINTVINSLLFLGHPAFGAFTALVGIFLSPVFSAMIFAGFMIYEISEDWRITDNAFYDIRDYLWGFCSVLGADLTRTLFILMRSW